MSDPKVWAEAIKDILNWSAPLLPVRLGWILVFAAVVWGLTTVIKAWRAK